MLSDIEIAQQAKMQKITDVAAKLGISEDDIELYGKYKAKLSYDLIRRVKDKKDGKLILVTAITPTPAGEGKSTTTVGLAQGLAKLGKKVIVALREPSLGPAWALRAALQAAAIPRLCRWRTSTCTLPVTSMLSPPHICCWQQCWTTISNRATL